MRPRLIRHMGEDLMLDILLTDPMQEYVQKQIKSGAYANVSEVVLTGIRLLMRRMAHVSSTL
ncbi:type II toxin-antitoxin system ParD family antitoxin [Roseivivax sp. THAF197b]|uniref:ribbon-helix-helix domain-containing protein n=1 Tax=Roseivivax sp. THAF197b TaxID=2588299 RepID=UPI00352AE8D0